MWIRGSHAGQGLGTGVLRAMLQWGFEGWGWQRLSWHCDTRNHASASVARKNGMVLEGTRRSDALDAEGKDAEGKRRDTYIFSMLQQEWLARGRAAE
jgi:RimJ/RimL family protein N-acetyltransferase